MSGFNGWCHCCTVAWPLFNILHYIILLVVVYYNISLLSVWHYCHVVLPIRKCPSTRRRGKAALVLKCSLILYWILLLSGVESASRLQRSKFFSPPVSFSIRLKTRRPEIKEGKEEVLQSLEETAISQYSVWVEWRHRRSSVYQSWVNFQISKTCKFFFALNDNSTPRFAFNCWY